MQIVTTAGGTSSTCHSHRAAVPPTAAGSPGYRMPAHTRADAETGPVNVA
jgi:hypothetical protein